MNTQHSVLQQSLERDCYSKLKDGNETIIDVSKFNWDLSMLSKLNIVSGRYYNIPCCFDIETTSWTDVQIKKATMYIWMFNICGYIFIGRYWTEFVELNNRLHSYLKLVPNRRLLVYVHNLDYEFQFMRKWFDWVDIFSDKKRSPLYALTNKFIEYRCSYKLSGKALASLANDIKEFPVQKLTGNLDYRLLRHSKTKLTKAELAYCYNDTKVVCSYIYDEIKRNDGIQNIPLTKTGYVRNYCRKNLLRIGDEFTQQEKIEGMKYGDVIRSLHLDRFSYELCKKAFMGGFTHANVYKVNKTIRNVASFDFDSSYPYNMMVKYFPMSSPRLVEITSMDMLDRYTKNYCTIIRATLYNVKSINSADNPISKHKCEDCQGYVVNNGRIVSALKLTLTFTELDLEVYKNFYSFDKITVHQCLVFTRGRLPKDFVKVLLSLYAMKTELKGVEGKEEDYLLGKSMLNSSFGMAVTDIIRNEVIYFNQTWMDTKSQERFNKQLASYNNNFTRFLYYPWGIYITAHARYNLFTGILEFGDDYIYSDTDSLKVTNIKKHMDYIKKYNSSVLYNISMASKELGIELTQFHPKSKKGIEVTPGIWSYEGMYKRFKTLGAKRYLYEDQNNELHFTVAGISKKAIHDYMLMKYSNNTDIFRHFTRNLTIPAEYTNKLTHTYVDDDISGVLTDYKGKKGEYYEKSYINLEPTSFTLSIIDAFWDYMTGVQQIER